MNDDYDGTDASSGKLTGISAGGQLRQDGDDFMLVTTISSGKDSWTAGTRLSARTPDDARTEAAAQLHALKKVLG